MKYILLTIVTLTFSFTSLAADIITDNATNEEFCSKFFYRTFIMAQGKRLLHRKNARKSSLNKLILKFKNVKETCELSGKSFSNCAPKIRSSSPRKRWQYRSSVRYSCI